MIGAGGEWVLSDDLSVNYMLLAVRGSDPH